MTVYYVVRDGEILFRGTEEEVEEIIEHDMSGKLEIYPEDGKVDTNNM